MNYLAYASNLGFVHAPDLDHEIEVHLMTVRSVADFVPGAKYRVVGDFFTNNMFTPRGSWLQHGKAAINRPTNRRFQILEPNALVVEALTELALAGDDARYRFIPRVFEFRVSERLLGILLVAFNEVAASSACYSRGMRVMRGYQYPGETTRNVPEGFAGNVWRELAYRQRHRGM